MIRHNERTASEGAAVLMLLTNAYEPDPRVRQEALALTRMGCSVRIIAWDRDRKLPAEETIESVEIKRVFLSSRHGRGATQILFYALVYAKIIWLALRTRFDVIHCHDLDTLPAGYVIGALKRRPVVYDAHESFPDMLGGSVHPAICRVLVAIENFLIRRVDLLITVGEKLRRHFVSRGARRSTVVGNWKRIEEYTRGKSESELVRERLEIPQGAFTVACITQILKDRKIEELLEAVVDSPEVFLIIGGAGLLEPVVRRYASECARIRFVGFATADQIPGYTCAADVVYYGFDPANPNAQYSAPNKLFEALAAGKPIICGDFGEIADVIREARCGVVLTAYSTHTIRAAFRELRDAEYRLTLSRNSKRFGSTYMNWARGEEILYREYTTLIPGILRNPQAATAAKVLISTGANA